MMQTWSRRTLLLGGVGWLLAACSQGAAGNIPYSVGVNGEGNQLSLVQQGRDADSIYIATVQSPRGIGQATVAWWGSMPLHPLHFVLPLRGLEQFVLRWRKPTGSTLVNVGVSSMDQSVYQSVQSGQGDETEITPESPYWMPVTLPSAAEPVFTLSAPPAFVADAPRLFAISWVDFYR